MAFVRRYRFVLVPLFVAVLAALGALVLLPSGSQEPGSGGQDAGAEFSTQWHECVELRNDHMRVWRVVHRVESVDPETQETIADEIVSTVREVGSNLCYRDSEDRWQPSVAEWELSDAGFKSERGGHQVSFGATLGAGYTKTVSGRAFWMRARSLVLSDGPHTTLVAEIDPNAAGRIDKSDPAKLVFANAFGQALKADIEYVLEKASFHQNVVLGSPIALPEGFDPKSAQLYVFTELGLDDALADDTVSVHHAGKRVIAKVDGAVTPFSKNTPIAFHCTELSEVGRLEARNLFAFADSRVYDSAAGSRRVTLAERRLWRDPTDEKVYLVERLPHAWLAAAAYPVTLDYETTSGMIDSDVWHADATYYVSSDVSVDSEQTLTIEPGTIVKFNSGAAINVTASNAEIVAQGEPYAYIVFTSKNDDGAGEKITGSSGSPSSGDYDEAINIGSSASSDSVIECCKIGYATDALAIAQDIGTIRHTIIRDCGDGLVFDGDSAPDLFNCLVADIGAYGVIATPYDVEFVFTITNCTFDHCTSAGVHTSTGPTGSVDLTAKNNLFTSNGYGVSKVDNGTITLDYNGWYTSSVSGTSKGNHAVNLTVSPYDTTNDQLGAYFIDTEDDPEETDGHELVNAGSGNAHDAELYGDGTSASNTLFEITAPEEIAGDITSSENWSRRDADGSASGSSDDPVDIGYHHPRVDKVIDNAARSIAGGVTLTVEPGVVVAFNGNSARLQFDAEAASTPALVCDGLPSAPIVLAGKPLVSMHVEAQVVDPGWTYDIKGVLLNDPDDEQTDASASITHTRLIGLHKAVYIAKDSANEVSHCVFERGQTALYCLGADGREITVSNCLFHDNRRGAIINLNSASTGWACRNCTYDGNEIGLVLASGGSASVIVTDCLFSNTLRGIQLSNPVAAFTHDHNAFCDCGGEDNPQMIWKTYYPPGPESIDASSKDIQDASPYAAGGAWAEQWYLDQSGPCVNGGSRTALAANMATFTTRLSDHDYDCGQVDIGYHYPTGLQVTDPHFDNEAGGGAGEIDILYDYGGNVSYRTIRIYNSGGDLVYEYAPSGESTYILLSDWDGTGNQTGRTGDLGTGTYMVVILGGAAGYEYARCRIYIEQSADATLEIQRPDDDETVDWF
jgi:hypothetical protein